MLTIENISFDIHKKRILKDVSFELAKGELAAILGPNGAGKSTLLRLIAGDIRPQQGRISFAGKEVLHYPVPELARMRAVLVQQSRMSMNFSVEETVLMGRYPHFNGKPARHDLEKVRLALATSSLQQMGRRMYTSLSGGEQQRANLSRALAQVWEGMEGASGKLLLLDEPLNNLDIEHQHQILEVAREFAARGNTVIAVLHDLNMAARFADQLLLLSDSSLFACGRPGEVLTGENIRQVFHYPAEVCPHPFLDCPMVYYGCCRHSGDHKSHKEKHLHTERSINQSPQKNSI